MVLVYTKEGGWKLRDIVQDEDYYLGTVDKPREFPEFIFGDLEAFYHPTDRGCWRWRGMIHRRRAGVRLTPYHYTPIGPPYPLQSPARQLVLAKYLNLDPSRLPSRLKIGMLCEDQLCVNPEHMIPYNYFPRTKAGEIAPQPRDEQDIIQTKHQRELELLQLGETREERQRRYERENAEKIHKMLDKLDGK